MSACPYSLPSFVFVGGSSKTITINLYDAGGDPFPVDAGITVTFVLGSFLDDSARPVLSLSSGGVNPSVTVETGDSGEDNRINVRLDPSDTFDLHGRYVYQIALTDSNQDTEVLGQGGITILRNLLAQEV